jgi:hypothetical protein
MVDDSMAFLCARAELLPQNGRRRPGTVAREAF